MKRNENRKKKLLSADDIDELIEMADDEKVRRFWQTIKEEKLRKVTVRKSRSRRFLSVPLYNNSAVLLFILALLSFIIWFLLSYTGMDIPVDITKAALVIAFSFSAIIFHRYISDKEEIVTMLDEIAGYSIQNESVFENIGNALIVVDAAGKIIKVNRKAEAIMEAKSYELINKHFQDVLPHNKLSELLMDVLRSGAHIANCSVNLESSTGHKLSLQVTASLLQNKKGHTIGAVEVINDVTQIRELQEKLKLNEHLASIGELSAKLGHEIGNSLGGIKLFTDNLLEELQPDDHRRDYAEEILSEVERLMASVTALKDYSRPVKLYLKETNMNKIMDEIILFSMDKIKESGIVVQKHLGQEIPTIVADPDQLRVASMNVVINAIQAMPTGGELDIFTQRVNGTLELAIRDTGNGIPEKIRGKIFNPFFTTKKILGTGLGLSIAYKNIKSHGGTIDFESKEGIGTTFKIGLPVDISFKEQQN